MVGPVRFLRTVDLCLNFVGADALIGPLGPGFAKMAAGAVPLPRLALPSRCGWCWGVGRGLPDAPLWETAKNAVGAAISRPQNRTQISLSDARRGRCPHRPVSRCVVEGLAPHAKAPLVKGGCREAAGGFYYQKNAVGFLFAVGAGPRPPVQGFQYALVKL